MKSVLHGTWVTDRDGRTDGEFFVWAERVGDVPPHGEEHRPRIARHPFAATTIEIADLLTHYVPRTDWRRASRLTRVAYLPSVSGVPVVPRWMHVGAAAPREDAPRLEAWRIEGIGIPVLQVLDVLAVLPASEDESYSEHRVGEDLRYWGLVAKFALELLARQRFLPGVRGEDGRFVASWLPYLDDPGDQARFAALTRGMPPVCRAVLRERQGISVEDAPSPYVVLSSFIQSLVDEAVREWTAEVGRGDGGQSVQRSRAARVSQSWWQALYSRSREIWVSSSRKQELNRFYQAWQSWTYRARSDSDLDFRVCFRLEPPDYEDDRGDEDASRWRVRYLLQSLEDPSLLVPASEVWRERGRMLTHLDQRLDRAQDILLAGLGRAARLCPAVQRSLREPNPEGTTLSAKEAYRFLRETSRLLEDAGFGVMVPPWWNKPDASLSVRARLHGSPEITSSGMLSMNTLVSFDWELALGDETLTQEEFERLAELKTPLVKVRGRWVLLQPDQVEAAITFWERQRSRSRIPLHEALSLALGVDTEIDGLAVSHLEVSGWLADLLAALDRKEQVQQAEAPEGFVGQLRPYQVRGLSWLAFLRKWGLSACLADDMGLGKTIQAIALLLQEKENENGRMAPALLVCPTSLVGNWAREVRRFAPGLRVLVHHGASRAEGSDFVEQSLQHDLVISTYGLVRRDLKDLMRLKWSNVILDEAQNIKNPLTKQARAVRRLSSDYRLALTGTPIENRLTELWSIMSFLLPGYLGPLETFRREFAVPIERYQDEEAAERLRRLVRPFILRRLKTDPLVIQDLPEKFEHKVYCNLTREQVTLYEAVVRDAMMSLRSQEAEYGSTIRRRGLVLAMLTRLKQVCDHPALFLGDGSPTDRRSGKLNRLTEMLEEVLAVGDRALVFTQFAQMGYLLQRHLQDVFAQEVLFLHGGTPQPERDRMLSRFQEDEDAPSIFVLSLKAGGTGLNLMRANHVFHFDRWWNPAVEDQATDRAYRIGQTRNVQVHKFICPGTLEERIDALIESKVALADNVVGAGEGWLTELSTEDLRDLIVLRSEVVDDE